MIRLVYSSFVNTSTAAAASPDLWVGQLSTYDDFQAASTLYREVFSYAKEDFALNANLLTALVDNGGTAVGARDVNGRLVGFAYGFMGSDGQDAYHYSQAAVVDPHWQGHGIGWQLKDAQRAVVLGLGFTHMRWTYNPLHARNGHFNLGSLGAVGIKFVHDYYGRPDTDRLLVDWSLGDDIDPYAAQRGLPAPEEIAHAATGEIVEAEGPGGAVWVALPAGYVAGRRTRRSQAEGSRLRRTIDLLMSDDRVLVDCQRVGNDMAAYLAVARRR